MTEQEFMEKEIETAELKRVFEAIESIKSLIKMVKRFPDREIAGMMLIKHPNKRLVFSYNDAKEIFDALELRQKQLQQFIDNK